MRILTATEAKRLQTIEVSKNKVARIVNEGKRVGYIPQSYQPIDDSVFDYLNDVAKTQVEASDVIPDFGETIQTLSGEQRTLQTRLSELNQDLRAAKAFLFDQTDFTKEANEQRARLKSVEIYKSEPPLSLIHI